MAWSGHILLTDPAPLWHVQRLLPGAVELRVLRHRCSATPRLGMIGSGPVAAIVCATTSSSCWRTRSPRSAPTRWSASSAPGAPAARSPAPRSPTRRGCWRRPATCTSSPSAASRWPWRCSPAGTAVSFRHGYRPERRHAGWALAGWLVAAWQLSLGFGIGLPFAYVLAAARCRASLVPGCSSASGVCDGHAGRSAAGCSSPTSPAVLIFAAVGGLLALPYFEVADDAPVRPAWHRRDPALLAAAARLLHRARRSRGSGVACTQTPRDVAAGRPEMTLLPGFVLYRAGPGRPGLLDLDGPAAPAARARRRWSPRSSRWAPSSSDGALHLPAAARAPARLGRHPHPRPADALGDAAARHPRRRRGRARSSTGSRRSAGAADPAVAGPVAAAGHADPAAAGAGRGLEHHPAPDRAGPARRDAYGRAARCWCCPATSCTTRT